MNMRHGTPPILKTLALGIEPSLSVDVECTLTADMFTQMRAAMALQRALVNQMILEQDFANPTVSAGADTRPAHHAGRAALRHDQRREGPAAGPQGRAR